jgi:hypothetical protein
MKCKTVFLQYCNIEYIKYIKHEVRNLNKSYFKETVTVNKGPLTFHFLSFQLKWTYIVFDEESVVLSYNKTNEKY